MSALIYDGGRQTHMTSSQLDRYMAALEYFNGQVETISPDDQMEISDRVAQTIAAMWVNPANPNTTALATRGQVLSGARMNDFATTDEYRTSSDEVRRQLDYLGTYLVRKHVDAL